MYKVVETDKQISWNFPVTPLITLADEYGGRAQIVEDGHCLVLLLKAGVDTEDTHYGYKPACWWFREAVNAVREMKLPARLSFTPATS
jgi:hypothetical protein